MKIRIDTKPSEPLVLKGARVHEAEGIGRRAFALFQAARQEGAVVWVLPPHRPHLPMLGGLPDGVGERLHVICPPSETDMLWAIEESLRSAPVGMVLAEPQKPLSLTAGRRLQLAAEAGGTLGLMLIDAGRGSNAAETRWHCAPVPAEGRDSTAHRWNCIKNKKGTTGAWIVYWNGTQTAFDLVSATGERHDPSQMPG